MTRKFLCGLALALGLTFAVGCSGSSSAPVLSKEEQEKQQKDMIERQKKMMPGMSKPPEGGTAPAPAPDPTKEKK